MATLNPEEIREVVRQRYGAIAETWDDQTGDPSASCCGEAASSADSVKAQRLGYAAEDTDTVPEGANHSLGCGNPIAIASLRPGETVVDLGSGAGFDCFLAARAVGETGHVIGVDMTHAMLHKARANAAEGGYTNTEFRLGEIEHLPVADNTVDVIISNCVINLSPDKPQVFRDALRVLKPGGRLAISDVVTTAPFPEEVLQNTSLLSCCVTGASLLEDVERMLAEAGFIDIRMQPKDESKTFIRDWVPGSNIEKYLVSAVIEAVKP